MGRPADGRGALLREPVTFANRSRAGQRDSIKPRINLRECTHG
ncbi:hypothetical protein OH687_24750 [Burkholderia anthina]|nr:hypothetical protein OH687_24750 [Burkholderia anthina]